MTQSLAVCALEPFYNEPAKDLAKKLNLKFITLKTPLKFATDFDYLLLVSDHLAIARTGKGAPAPVRVDFTSGAVAHRRKFGGGKGQDIAKAVGLNKRAGVSVFDATAGLGRDAFVLATLGCHVTLFERVGFVRALLESGLDAARYHDEVDDIMARMTLAPTTLVDHLGSLADVVYLDPMYPHTEKSAAAKKEMAFFRDLIGHDSDADALLPIALESAKYRVVVKRPKGAPYLNDQAPTYQLDGKSGRFDIYVLKSLDGD
jgi:16S rRNA (guanine1516-N2)-methyltransferase